MERLKILKEQVQALKLAESNSRAFLHKFQMRNSKFNTISSSHNKKHHITLVTLKKPMAKELSSSSESTPPSEVRSRNIPFYSGEPSYLDSSEFKQSKPPRAPKKDKYTVKDNSIFKQSKKLFDTPIYDRYSNTGLVSRLLTSNSNSSIKTADSLMKRAKLEKQSEELIPSLQDKICDSLEILSIKKPRILSREWMTLVKQPLP